MTERRPAVPRAADAGGGQVRPARRRRGAAGAVPASGLLPGRRGALAGRRYFSDLAWLGGPRLEAAVLLSVAADGSIASLEHGVARPADAVHLRGLTLPGLANTHSHAFHRALRGRAQRQRGDFWSWRRQMYDVAERLDPDRYFDLARAVYMEMALAGVTCVGEFHYLHHGPGGHPYDDPNAMAGAVTAAAADAGLRLTLLDTCYLSAGAGRNLSGAQLRFADRDVAAWAERASHLADGPGVRVGAAVHSVRAVPPDAARRVARWAEARGAPLHAHLSEQRAENEECNERYGVTPAELLEEAGVLGRRSAVVHAVHLTASDVVRLGDSGTTVCACPTTERDLGDGIARAAELQGAGCPLALGSDSHAVIDLLEEARALEMDERLRTERRACWSPEQLLEAATVGGHTSLGWPGAGRLAVGMLADLVTLDTGSVRLAGASADPLASAVYAATAADVRQVVVGGRHVVRDGRHIVSADVAGDLASAIAPVVR